MSGGRYRMLETVRAFCAERLADAGEADQLRRAHTTYFLELAWTASDHLRCAEQLHWLRRLDAERDNLHAALRRATAAGDGADAAGLVAALSFYWWLRGMRGKGATGRRRPRRARRRSTAGVERGVRPLRLQRLARRLRPPAHRNAAVRHP
ncbi:hypothetical protein NKG94_38800 [Micromonospora sp. M12]